MKLALVFNLDDHKLSRDNYSQVYRSQFVALMQRFDSVQYVVESCSAKDIEADVIIFYDVHSAHHIVIDGIEKHSAVKYEYLNDPHQKETVGVLNVSNRFICKLNCKARIARVLERGVSYIICPSTTGYFKHFAPLLGKRAEEMLLWFPLSPTIRYFTHRTMLLPQRAPLVLGNGSMAKSGDVEGYQFRQWAYRQKCIYFRNHCLGGGNIPKGKDYPDYLALFVGGLALNSVYTVPKYSEIPLAGCVCFAQEHPDYTKMGFKDGESCIYVNKENFVDTINAFKSDIPSYQPIADAGRKLMEDNWTAEKFADHIWQHAKDRV